ncbi:MAG: hypothetical protein HEQ23_14590 [Tepidisphaera sp.]|jgi:hypothetical protein
MSNRPVVQKFVAALALGVAGLSLSIPQASARFAPEPDPIPRRWQLDLKPGPLRLARVANRDGTTQTYVYMTYRATNKTGEDVLFAPSFELADGEGNVLRSGRGVPLDVASKIQSDLNNPFLEDQISVLGMMLQGDENAKDGIVVWPLANLTASELTVYAAGFSGEVAQVEIKDPKSGALVKEPMYKTFMARYKTGGDMSNRGSEPFEPYETTWIMR